MKKIWLSILMLSAYNVSHADLMGDLRSLRGTLSEVTQTSKELSEASKQTGLISNDATANQSATNPSASGDLKSGDVLYGKLSKTRLLSDSNRRSKNVAQLSQSEQMIYMGEEVNGFYRVTATAGEGWVDKLLVKKGN